MQILWAWEHSHSQDINSIDQTIPSRGSIPDIPDNGTIAEHSSRKSPPHCRNATIRDSPPYLHLDFEGVNANRERIINKLSGSTTIWISPIPLIRTTTLIDSFLVENMIMTQASEYIGIIPKIYANDYLMDYSPTTLDTKTRRNWIGRCVIHFFTAMHRRISS